MHLKYLQVIRVSTIFNAFEINHPIEFEHLIEAPTCLKLFLILDQATYVSKLVRQLQVSQRRITEQAQTTALKLSLKQQVYFLYNICSIYVVYSALFWALSSYIL